MVQGTYIKFTFLVLEHVLHEFRRLVRFQINQVQMKVTVAVELVLITIEIFLTSSIKIFFRQTACLNGVVDNVQIRQLRVSRLRLRLDKFFDEVLCFGGGSKRKYISSSHPRQCKGRELTQES